MDYDDIAAALKAHDVVRVFGVPGTQVVPLLEAIRSAGITFTLAAHESGAAFMALGYAKATGRPGVALVIGGPGLTNSLTGVAEANLDSVPLLLITSAPAGPPGDRFRLQSIDQAGVSSPLVKACLTLAATDEPGPLVARALSLTMVGEPGPVLLQVQEGAGYSAGEEARPNPGRADHVPPISPRALDELADRWSASPRRLVYAGQGAIGAAGPLRELLERYGAPLLTTPSGRGLLPESHSLALGFDPLKGGIEEANRLLEEAHLVLILGAKLGHNGTAGYRLRFPVNRTVHVDQDPAIAGKAIPCGTSLVTTVEEVVRRLGSLPDANVGVGWDPVDLQRARQVLRTPSPDANEPRLAGRDSVASFFQWLRDALPPETILVTDSGQHQIMTRRHYPVLAPGGLVLPSDLQAMGFGIPAGIGAALSGTGRPVAAVVGDGGFLMSGMELTTAVRESVPLLLVVVTDGHLNQIRLQQLREYGCASGVDVGRLALEVFAYSVGAEYVRYDAAMPLSAIRDALSRARPTVLELPLRDSPALRNTARLARLKARAHAILGTDRISSLKRWLGRS